MFFFTISIKVILGLPISLFVPSIWIKSLLHTSALSTFICKKPNHLKRLPHYIHSIYFQEKKTKSSLQNISLMETFRKYKNKITPENNKQNLQIFQPYQIENCEMFFFYKCFKNLYWSEHTKKRLKSIIMRSISAKPCQLCLIVNIF